MKRLIYCIKRQTQDEGLDFPPYPGELGERIYQSISKSAWQQWIDRQTMLLNENRLSTLDTQTREFLKKEMELFLFGSNEEVPPPPPGYSPPSESQE